MHFNGLNIFDASIHCLSVCAILNVADTFCNKNREWKPLTLKHTHFEKGQKIYPSCDPPLNNRINSPDWLRLVCTQSELCLSLVFSLCTWMFSLWWRRWWWKIVCLTLYPCFQGVWRVFFSSCVCACVPSVFCFFPTLFHQVFINHFYWKRKKKNKIEDARPFCMM